MHSVFCLFMSLALACPAGVSAALNATFTPPLAERVASSASFQAPASSATAAASFNLPMSASLPAGDITGSSTVGATPSTAGLEMPTEGGFVFYNRQLITATLGKSRQVLLTFDDGPHPVNTPYVLDVLKRLDLKAVFFLVGTNARKYPEIVRRIAAEGHTIGNHTFYHPNLCHCTAVRITKEIRENNELIRQITGVKPTLFRPPYGGVNQRTLEILRQEGMSVMLWSVDPGDWRNRNITRTVENLKRQLAFNHGGRGGIVLLHDTLPSSAHALEPFLTALVQEGLLPTGFGNPGPRGRRYWALRDPQNTRWQETAPAYQVETFACPFLTSVLKGPRSEMPTPMAMLRAKKSGDFLKVMLCRGFGE
ncbi:MAG: polysaccharide deacetylase family protein [Candidatus Ozemobacteraceae bacterium]